MIELRNPIYQRGQTVWSEIDLINDGSYPDREKDALLVKAGTEGEIVQVGFHEEANLPVYMVEFTTGDVVGCLEEEIRAEQARTSIAGLL